MRTLADATRLVRRVVDLVLLVLVAVVLLAVALGKGAPLVGRQTIIIAGGSMEPALGLGSAIVIEPVDPARLAVGDVVSLQVGTERATFTHRIIAVVDRADGRWIRTKGDANGAPDPTLVPASAVIGRVTVSIPLMGYLLALLSLPVGVIFVLGLSATLLAIAWLLESLEPGRPILAAGVATAEVSDGRARTPRPAGDDLAARRGEPIAARSIRTGAREPALSTAFAAANGSSVGPDLARPTVREQLARSREVHRRFIRWQLGHGRDPRPGHD